METRKAVTMRTYTPWQDYADGQWREAVRGRDFTGPPCNFAIACRAWARRRGWPVQASVTGDIVSFRITPEGLDMPDVIDEPRPQSVKARLQPQQVDAVLAKAVKAIQDYAENCPEGEFRNGLLRAAQRIAPIADLPAPDPVP